MSMDADKSTRRALLWASAVALQRLLRTSHSLRTAPCCEIPQERWIRNYYVEGALVLHLPGPGSHGRRPV